MDHRIMNGGGERATFTKTLNDKFVSVKKHTMAWMHKNARRPIPAEPTNSPQVSRVPTPLNVAWPFALPNKNAQKWVEHWF